MLASLAVRARPPGRMFVKAQLWSTLGAAALSAIALKLALPAASLAQPSVDAEGLFKARCATCHEPAIERAPSRQSMRLMSVADLSQIMTSGAMAPMAAGMSTTEIQALAVHLGAPPQQQAQQGGRGGDQLQAQGGRGGGRGGAAPVWNPTITDKMCAPNQRIRDSNSDFTSFGGDPENTRYQRHPGFRKQDIPRLKVKWAYSVRAGSYGAPVVVGNHLFLATRGSGIIALDTRTGCVHWRNNDIQARTTAMAIRRPDLTPSGWVSFVGSRDRTVSAINLQNGKVVWKSEPLDTHGASGITGAPIVHENKVFVPLTSGEEGSAGAPNYPCCSFRGSLAALDARTGKKLWQTSMIQEPMRKLRVTSVGTQLQGPAGAAIWSAPTIDKRRNQVLVATGDSYTDADTKGADAIVALDMDSGRIKWMSQVTPGDNFIVGCNRRVVPENCPENAGPDYDFGASPVLRTFQGRDIILAGQKSGEMYGLDPVDGKVIWKTRVGSGSSLGGIEWGIAADDRYVYAPNSDIGGLMEIANRSVGRPSLSDKWFEGNPKPGVTALAPLSGRIVWHTPTPQAPCQMYGDRSRDRAQGCFPASSAAPMVIPGALFAGSTDGWLRAYDADNGKIIWEFSTTAQRYNTTNGVQGQPGGSIDSMGPTAAMGMVFVMSGYNGAANVGGNGTNVLLAFSVDGK